MEDLTREDLMRYLDGELSPEEVVRVDQAVAASTELRRELAIYTAMRHDLTDLSFSPEPAGSLWQEVNARIARPVGWILMVVGALVWALYGGWIFITSPVNPWEKLGVGTLAIGFLVLLISTVWERQREVPHDPYRHVER